jgi:hypothetical protein
MEDVPYERSEVGTRGLTIVPEDSDVSIVGHKTLIWGRGEGIDLVSGASGPLSLFVLCGCRQLQGVTAHGSVVARTPHNRVWTLPRYRKHDLKSCSTSPRSTGVPTRAITSLTRKWTKSKSDQDEALTQKITSDFYSQHLPSTKIIQSKMVY